VGGVAAVREREDFHGRCGLARDGFDLSHGAVLIIFALNGEEGARDAREKFLDVPASEFGAEPDMVPSPERAGRVTMMAGEFFGHVGGFEFHFSFGDACDAEVFDEDMRREQDEAAELVMDGGVDEGDGTSVAVADEDWAFDFELREKIRQGIDRLVVHVGDGTRLGERIGVAVAVAGVDGDGTSGGGSDAGREIFPERDGAEAFVEKDEFGRVGVACGDAMDFDGAALHGESQMLIERCFQFSDLRR